MRRIYGILWILFFLTPLSAEPGLLERLEAFPGIKVQEIKADSGFLSVYEIFLAQPVKHSAGDERTFKQKIVLSHRGFGKPVVMITEGYAMGSKNRTRELSEILNANEIRVEHRFFGDSRPDSLDWACLNIREAAQDHHRIVTLFKEIYHGKWVSTGWSKGGQTAIFHRRFYPDDVDATVAYDAPLNFAEEEPRIDAFFEKVGTAECREKLKQFQKMALQKKADMLSHFQQAAKEKSYTYSIGEEAAYEYMVLEYPFSFWQYHKLSCDEIPGEGADTKTLFAHLKKVVALSAYSDLSLNATSMYQFFTELGYYGYVRYYLTDWLSGAYNYSNKIFAPQGIEINFDPSAMQDIQAWLQTEGNNMLYIYGELDPWSAPAVDVSEKTNSMKMFAKGENHYTFINTFPTEEREKILLKLEEWLDYKIDRDILGSN